MVAGITNTTSALASFGSDTAAATETAAIGLADDFTSFINLLTTQLQNQDPSDPLDSNEVTSQIVQFTQAEQLVNINTSLEDVVAGIETSTAASAGTYVGREIEYSSPDFVYSSGEEVSIDYTLPSNADELTITVARQDGTLVRNITNLDRDAGRNTFTFDGTDNEGNPVESGTYTVTINAQNDSGNILDAQIINSGVVTRANFANGQLELGVGDIDLASSDIVSINGDAVLTALDQGLLALDNLNANNINGLGALNGAINQNSILASTLSLIDKQVEFAQDTVDFTDTGTQLVSYRLDEEFSEARFVITNAAGEEVFNNEVASEAGLHSFDISQVQVQGGTGRLPQGQYSVEIEITDDTGATGSVLPLATGQVTEVDLVGNTPTLFVGDTSLSINQITRIIN